MFVFLSLHSTIQRLVCTQIKGLTPLQIIYVYLKANRKREQDGAINSSWKCISRTVESMTELIFKRQNPLKRTIHFESKVSINL